MGTNRPGPTEFSKDALEHAWDWFSLHAGQRMQSFNFFLVATAFLVAAYGAVLERHRAVALGIGILGAWISLWFNRLEKRTRQLVRAGEAALGPSQEKLAELAAIRSMSILQAVEPTAPGGSSYSRVINVIQWTSFVGFLGGTAYAGWLIYTGGFHCAALHIAAL